MAINPETEFPGKIAPSSPQFPYGEAQNITVPGDGTGTPWVASLLNDIFGFQQAILSESAIVPSGTPDNATASQYLEGLKTLFVSRTGGAGVINGLTILNSAVDPLNDIQFNPGAAYSDLNTEIIQLNSVLIKKLDEPWAEGNNAGGRFTAVLLPNTTYYPMLIKRDFDGLVEAGFDDDISGANIPFGYTRFFRVGLILTLGASEIAGFTQSSFNPNYFVLKNPIAFESEVSPLPTGILRDTGVPNGLPLIAQMSFIVTCDANPTSPNVVSARFFSFQHQTDTDLNGSLIKDVQMHTLGAGQVTTESLALDILTDVNGQIMTRIQDDSAVLAATGCKFQYVTNGWFDPRGGV